jgi:transposase InsO family protein
MNIKMNDTNLNTPLAIEAFLKGTLLSEFTVDKSSSYSFIARTLKQTSYFKLCKKDKSIIIEYLLKITQYSRQQMTRLVAQYREHNWIGGHYSARHQFSTKYTREDILLLVQTDIAHERLSGLATKKLFERAHQVYHDMAYERLACISVAHIYNLRKSKTYQQKRYNFDKTKRTPVSIGERRKPVTNGKPGYIRIDTVHQGDLDKQKGVYHINATDEVTQFEVVCSVEKISEQYLIPVLAALLAAFPFEILGFHSDNGSEYINKDVERLLSKLHVEFTKSRSRKSNDNALAECKNGAIIRKHLGYIHIPQKWAPLLNEFNLNYLTPYINYHRPCLFAEEITDKKGKIKKKYPYKLMMTPYEKLKSLPGAEQYLKPGTTFKELDELAMQLTDIEAAELLQKAKKIVFKKIFEG